MLIDLRAPDRLRGPKALDLGPVLSAVLEATRAGVVDPSRLRVVCDWVQYKESFREPVVLRHIAPSALETASASRVNTDDGEPERYEVAIDVRRRNLATLSAELGRILASAADGDTTGRLYLEQWGPGSASCIWAFNALYWRALSLWEQATGRGYEQALPGGESDATNLGAARELILQLFALWDDLSARRALPEELHVLELGVGNGNQARVWLDEFQRLDHELGKNYYRRLQYLMGDYSAHVLDRARGNVHHHADRLSSLVLDATRPTDTLGFLRYKLFLVYISNVYDNLPTDEVVRLGGHLFLVQVRAYLAAETGEQLARELQVAPSAIPDLVTRLLRLGPELLAEAAPDTFATPLAAVRFWRDAWQALRLEERYVPLEELDAYRVAPEVTGETLRPIVEANGDVRMHVSNGAVASFADTLTLLHPYGELRCTDLFVTDLNQYTTGFRGPGKYDGSVVNWVNGPLLVSVGSRHGYQVSFEPFAHRVGSNVQTLTARVRE